MSAAADAAGGVQGVVPDDVKLLPGQLLDIRQTVREARPPPLPHRPPLPSFESPYAHIDDCDSEAGENNAAAEMPQDNVAPDVDTDRLCVCVFLSCSLSIPIKLMIMVNCLSTVSVVGLILMITADSKGLCCFRPSLTSVFATLVHYLLWHLDNVHSSVSLPIVFLLCCCAVLAVVLHFSLLHDCNMQL